MIRNCCPALVFVSSLAAALPAHAHIFGHFGFGSEVDYACKPHHHGRFLHRCSDEYHDPRIDKTHDHPGLPIYYARKPDFYGGLKYGALRVSSKNYEADKPTMAALLGYGFHGYSAEIEFSTATIKSIENFGFPFQSNESSYDTLSTYLVGRSNDQLYLKAKIGFRKTWTKIGGKRQIDEDFTFGVGAGKQLGRFTMEGELTVLEEDVHLYTVGITYKF